MFGCSKWNMEMKPIITVVGLEMKFMNKVYPVLISASHVPELHILKKTDCGICVGAAITMEELNRYLKDIIKEESGKCIFLFSKSKCRRESYVLIACNYIF